MQSLLLLIVAVLFASSPSVVTSEGGPQIPFEAGNLARTGEMPGPSPAGALVPVWTHSPEYQPGGWSYVLASPGVAIADGTAYYGYWDRLYAVDTATGWMRWAFRLPGEIMDTPAVSGGVVYAGTLQGSLVAVDVATGWQLWQGPGGSGSPIVTDGLVISADLTPTDDPYDQTSVVYALDETSGTVRWRTEVDRYIASPAAADGILYIGSDNGTLIALDLATGVDRWSLAISDAIVQSPVVANGLVFVHGTDGATHAIDAVSGQPRWHATTSQLGPLVPLAVADGTVYLGGIDGRLLALDAETGTEIWTTETDLGSLRYVSIAGGVLYVTAMVEPSAGDSFLLSFDADNGAEQHRIELGFLLGIPSVIGGTVIVTNIGNGSLYKLRGSGEYTPVSDGNRSTVQGTRY